MRGSTRRACTRPPAGRERADAALHCFLARVFEDSSDFVLSEERFDDAFRDLERIVGDGRSETVVVVPLLGVELASDAVAIGDGLSLNRGDACAEAPDDARWARGDGHPQTLAVLRWEPAAGDEAPLGHARVRLRRLLIGLHLYDGTRVGFAPLAWTRTGSGTWQPFALGFGAVEHGRPADRRRTRRTSCARSSASWRAARRATARSPGRCGASSSPANGRRPRRR